MTSQEALRVEDGEPPLGERISYAEYEAWATTVLLHPDDLLYYQHKAGEEHDEFRDPTDEANALEEAGDFLWALTVTRKLAYNRLGGDRSKAAFHGMSLANISRGPTFDMSLDELVAWVVNEKRLYLRKARNAWWYMGNATPEVKAAYVTGVMDERLPQMVAAITRITELRTGKGIDEILERNIQKLEDRIASGTLDKSTRGAVQPNH